jgi:hypothetical protein
MHFGTKNYLKNNLSNTLKYNQYVESQRTRHQKKI